MKTFKNFIRDKISFVLLLGISFTLLLIQACKKEKNSKAELEKENVIEIITEVMDFQMPDTILSGWNTLRYKNLSPQTHFILINKYPEGKTAKDMETDVSPVFDSGMKLINEGNPEAGFAEFSKLPEWFGQVVPAGGIGLLSPGKTGETTLNLKPGMYVLECYVKMSNGVFHTSMGMTKDLVVSDTDSGNKAPSANIDISISSNEGIVFNEAISSGKHIFSVHFKDQIAHENFVGHDINLVKIVDNANLKGLENWMNWADPKGLIEPAPASFIFLGGVNDMHEGNTAYFMANLEIGNYALISEVPNSLNKNLLKTFKVTN